MNNEVWPILLFLLLLVGGAAAILLAGDWIKRRRVARKYPAVSNGRIAFQLPCRFEFTSATEDLLQAYAAERTAVSGLRSIVRWCVIGMGCAWLLGAIVFWRKASGLQLTIWIGLGVAILWRDAVKPFLKRWEIRRTAAGPKDLVLDFTEAGIHIEVQDVGVFDRSWQELDAAIDTDEGVLVYFNDGIVNWLPRRLFQDNKSKTDLYTFLVQRLLDNEEQQD